MKLPRFEAVRWRLYLYRQPTPRQLMRLIYGLLEKDDLTNAAHRNKKRPPFAVKTIEKKYADICTWGTATSVIRDSAKENGYILKCLESSLDINIPHPSELDGAIVQMGPTAFFNRELDIYPYYNSSYFWQSIINVWSYITQYKLPFTPQEADLYCPVVRLETRPDTLFIDNKNSMPAFSGQVQHVFNAEVSMETRYLLAELFTTASFTGIGRKTTWGGGNVETRIKSTPVDTVMLG